MKNEYDPLTVPSIFSITSELLNIFTKHPIQSKYTIHWSNGDLNEINLKANFSDWRWGDPCENAFRRMSLDLTYEKSTLVQVMAWGR